MKQLQTLLCSFLVSSILIKGIKKRKDVWIMQLAQVYPCTFYKIWQDEKRKWYDKIEWKINAKNIAKIKKNDTALFTVLQQTIVLSGLYLPESYIFHRLVKLMN